MNLFHLRDVHAMATRNVQIASAQMTTMKTPADRPGPLTWIGFRNRFPVNTRAAVATMRAFVNPIASRSA